MTSIVDLKVSKREGLIILRFYLSKCDMAKVKTS